MAEVCALRERLASGSIIHRSANSWSCLALLASIRILIGSSVRSAFRALVALRLLLVLLLVLLLRGSQRGSVEIARFDAWRGLRADPSQRLPLRLRETRLLLHGRAHALHLRLQRLQLAQQILLLAIQRVLLVSDLRNLCALRIGLHHVASVLLRLQLFDSLRQFVQLSG